MVTINHKGIVTGWNSHAEKLFGWPRAEALGRELADLIIPERLREQHRSGMHRYVESGVARVLNKRIEMSALHRDGTEFPVELAITPIGFGDDLVFSGFIRDITSRVRAEAALRESEQRFRTTANAAPVLIWMSGKDKRCHLVQPALARFRRPRHRAGDRRRLVRQPAPGRFRSHARHLSRGVRRAPAL